MADLPNQGDQDIQIKDGEDRNFSAVVNESGFLKTMGYGHTLMSETFTIDFDTTNRWLETIVGSASRSVTNQVLELSVTTASGDSIKESFRQQLIPVGGSLTEFTMGINLGATEQTNNVKEWGLLNSAGTNGIFFRLNGSTLYLVTVLGGSETTTDITSYKPSLADSPHIYRITTFAHLQYWVYVDGVMATYKVTTTPFMYDKELRPYFKHYNSGALGGSATDLEVWGMCLNEMTSSKVELTGITGNQLVVPVSVTNTGTLKVSAAITNPPETTAVTVTEYDDVATTDDNTYTIPSGETLVIQRLSGGGESGNGASVIELWYDPNGTGTGMTIIDAIHVNGSSDQHDINASYEGNGTRAIRMRRKRYGGGELEIFGRWEGYY